MGSLPARIAICTRLVPADLCAATRWAWRVRFPAERRVRPTTPTTTADSDVPHACQALLHKPQTAFDGPNQAVQELERVYGLDANHAEALVNQLIVLDKDDPAGWRPSQTCFDLWHQGYIK